MQLSRRSPRAEAQAPATSPLATVGLALVPLVLLAGVLALIAAVGLPAATSLPLDDLAVERVVLEPGAVEVRVRNVGPEPTEVTTVIVDDGLYPFRVEPAGPIPRLATASVHVEFPWVEGEPVTVALLTDKGFRFEAEVEAAVATPKPDLGTVGTLALIGLYVGAVPVLLGLLWRPLLLRVRERHLHLALGVTVGLLLFLALDTLLEGFEVAETLPGAIGAPFLLIGGAVAAYAILDVVGARTDARGRPAVVATLVALGVGLHNLAEGLAIGGAFALGEAALGAFLVIGFAVHNTTEGLAIVAPLGRERARIPFLVALGLLAGLPVVPGAWIGGFAPSPYLAVAFLGVGAGAIVQVARTVDDATGNALRRGVGLAGVAVGAIVMYATALLVSL